MLKHSKKTPGNKKRVRYGPVRYVNLKFDEPIFTNTYQISELCPKCGVVRSGPNINDGCKNCLVPKPNSTVLLNKSEFLSRAKRSIENLCEVEHEKSIDFQRSTYTKNSVSNKCDIEKINKNHSNENLVDSKVSKKLEEDDQNVLSSKQKLHSNDEISVLSFDDKIKLLEKNFHPREVKPRTVPNHEALKTEKKKEFLINKQEMVQKNQNKKRIDSELCKGENVKDKTPRTIRNLFKDEEKFDQPEKNLNDLDKKSIEEFESKLKFFENKNSSILSSTRSLESFEPKSIFIETCQTNSEIKSRESPVYGSNKSLDHCHFNVDNLNDIPKILRSISKTNFESSCTNIDQASENLTRIDKKDLAEIIVPLVKPRKNIAKITNENMKENIDTQHLNIYPKERQKNEIEKYSESCNLCKACAKVIKSDCVEAEGFFWHLDHFCCSECKCLLADKKYLVSDSKFLCLVCHQKKFLKICQTCRLGIDTIDTRFTYEKLHWHSNPNCFKCYKCCKNLCDVPFLIKKNRLFCSINCKKIFFDN